MARKKRDDGRVQVQVDIGVTEDGKRKRKYFYGRTLKEANAARDAWLAEQERRRRVTIADADVTLEEWSAMWLASIEGTTQGTTHKSTVSAVKQQNDFVFGDNHTRLGSLRVADLRPIHMQTYMRSLDGKSRSTISKRRHVLKSILNAAVANDIIQRSPWQDVKAPRGTYTGHRALSESEQRMIAETWRIHRCGVWAMLMLYAGLRKEELAALDVQDVDLAAGEIGEVEITFANVESGYKVDVYATNFNENGGITLRLVDDDTYVVNCTLINLEQNACASADVPLVTFYDTELTSYGSAIKYFDIEVDSYGMAGIYSGTMTYSFSCNPY